MNSESEDLTIFQIYYGVYKYKMMLFELINRFIIF